MKLFCKEASVISVVLYVAQTLLQRSFKLQYFDFHGSFRAGCDAVSMAI